MSERLIVNAEIECVYLSAPVGKIVPDLGGRPRTSPRPAPGNIDLFKLVLY